MLNNFKFQNWQVFWMSILPWFFNTVHCFFWSNYSTITILTIPLAFTWSLVLWWNRALWGLSLLEMLKILSKTVSTHLIKTMEDSQRFTATEVNQKKHHWNRAELFCGFSFTLAPPPSPGTAAVLKMSQVPVWVLAPEGAEWTFFPRNCFVWPH